MQNHASYLAPEIVELGAASALTLGQRDLPAQDGCQCAKVADTPPNNYSEELEVGC